ncbi:MAG: tetratricopeptide repeat protein [Polyangiaceae bacterium]|nr:tetratricopeptide repeat protein [Polyangiaceae bacterium]MBK8936463.1 tetratricopeptide repeat protein [Polyangiaceae bacterium]
MRRAAIALGLAIASIPAALPCPCEAEPAAAPQENWATARARALTEQAKAHRDAGASGQAVARLNEALGVDGTFEPAYLTLADLRAALGQHDEAILVLDMGLERIPGFEAALVAKADVLGRAKRWPAATAAYLDLTTRRPDDDALWGKLLDAAVRAGRFPVALAAARRRAVLARERGDDAAERDARLTSRALARLVAEADPVSAGREGRGPVRAAIAAATTR